jgi:hypothetical protein
MFERSEFVDPPLEIVQRGKPKAKVVGGLSFASFLWPSKKRRLSLFCCTVHMAKPMNSDPTRGGSSTCTEGKGFYIGVKRTFYKIFKELNYDKKI